MSRNVEAEAAALADRFRGVRNRAAFARDFQVPGGQAMIYQHIKALKPIGIAAARAYMRGFGCTLAEISTYLAAEAAAQGKMAAGDPTPPTVQEAQQVTYAVHNRHTQAVLSMMATATEEQQAQCVGAVALVLGRKPPSAENLKRRTGT